MYPGMPSTTSNLFTNSANQPNQITHQPIQNIYVNTHAPPPAGFAPIQAGFGQNYYDNFETQPAYTTYINPAAQGSHIPNPAGFSFHVGQMTVNATPFYGQGTPNNFVSHQQAPPHGQVQRNHVVQDLPVAQPYRPIIPETQTRIQWTPELHEAFTRAVEELGGCFNTTPKAILKRMNIMYGITGITREQVKSHLQKVRNTAPQNSEIADNDANMTNVTFDSGEFAPVVQNTALKNNSDPRMPVANVALDSSEFPRVDEYPTNNQSFDDSNFEEMLRKFCDGC